jgi:aminopeptidase N
MKPCLPLLTLAAAIALSLASPLHAADAAQAAGSTAAVPALPGARAENAFLSEADAAARAARVSNVAYVLDFQLTGEPTFSATTTVSFDLKDATTPLTLDLDKAKIGKLVVNGKTVAPAYNQWFITLPASALRKGRNTVTVAYTREHSTNGEGLHRFKDPTDGKVYLYSHFEPAAAHQMFAVFDQPDLKATYTLTATAPKDWVVISSTPETKVVEDGAVKHWTFPATPKLSPYNFSMHAGPYHMWEDRSGKYPMRLFARESVANKVHPADWFKYTKAGLAYYDDYFGIAYPFKKYDQILVPQFLYGAMENAGAVTFTEARFTSSTPMTAERRQGLASTILHEMAHQWFGDLVTMRWWNGLWLNESFASYMATIGSASSGEFEHPWLSQYRSKQGAYRTDESITTHPIEVPVPSTANAFDNIDAITYSKGASVLHQLRQRIGAETFRKGVHDYLATHAYGNATLDDFIGALSKASGQDLQPFAKEWLYQPGVNTLGAEFACTDGKVSRFALVQAPANPAWPTLREQLVQVALFDKAGDGLVLGTKQPVTYRGARTEVPELVGKACPALVYPNYEDWGFAKVVLDPASFATARAHLTQVDDPMLRSMLWQSLSDGLTSQRIGLGEFIDATLENAPKERDNTLLRQAFANMTTASGYLRAFADDGGAAGKARARAAQARIEAAAWQGLQADAANKDRAKGWLNTYIDVATTPDAVARLQGLLDGKVDAAGVEIDQEIRWNIVESLARNDAPGVDAAIAAELARDKGESGELAALAASLSRPEPKRKAEWLAKIQANDGSEPFARLRTAMRAMYPAGQVALSEATAAQRLETLAAIDAKGDPVFMRSYAGFATPGACTPASVARFDAAIAAAPATLSAGSRRALLGSREEDARCVAIRAKYGDTRQAASPSLGGADSGSSGSHR